MKGNEEEEEEQVEEEMQGLALRNSPEYPQCPRRTNRWAELHACCVLLLWMKAVYLGETFGTSQINRWLSPSPTQCSPQYPFLKVFFGVWL